jgi:hypothetical protein
LDVARPEDDGDRESEAQPKLVAEHGHGVAGVKVMARVTIVARVGFRHLMTGMWLGCFFVDFVCHVAHFALRNKRWTFAFAKAS